jgi:S-formylglutathione hydrolase
METVAAARAHCGTRGMYRHQSIPTGTKMTFSVFVPHHLPGATLPIVRYFIRPHLHPRECHEKRRIPRALRRTRPDLRRHGHQPLGAKMPDDPLGAYDFGLDAGFYVDASEEPYAKDHRMWSYMSTSCRRSSLGPSLSIWPGRRLPAFRWVVMERCLLHYCTPIASVFSPIVARA